MNSGHSAKLSVNLSWAPSLADRLVDILYCVRWGVAVSLLAVGGLLVLRAVIGGMESTLSTWVTLGVWGGVLCSVGVVRACMAALQPRPRWSPVDVAESLALAAFAVVLTIESAAWWSPVMAWLTWIVGEELWYRRVLQLGNRSSFRPIRHSTSATPVTLPPPAGDLGSTESEPPEEVAEETLLPVGIEQQITHTRAAGGERQIQGLVRVALAARQRLEVAHVSFCPPFEVVPEVVGHVLEGDGFELRATHIACYGVRWELQRSAANSEQSFDVVFYFEATERERADGSEEANGADP